MELYSNYFTHIVPCLFITINWFIGHRSLILCRTKYKIISKCSPQYFFFFDKLKWKLSVKKKHVLKQLIFHQVATQPHKDKDRFQTQAHGLLPSCSHKHAQIHA